MSFNSSLVTVFTAFLVVGCAATYTENRSDDEGVQLMVTKGVYIIMPADGRYGEKAYENSGQMTAAVVDVEFSKFTSEVKVSDACDLDDCLSTLNESEYGYLVDTEILNWEDRATEWSGKPDRISVKMSVYDLSTGDRLSHVILEGKSKWATMGGDHPQDLLPEPVGQYVASLYD